MIDILVGMKADLEMLRAAFGKAMTIGPVEEIDAQKGYRIRLGDGEDGPFLSPWYPHPETGKSSIPLRKGQIVGMVNPLGDARQGFLLRGGYSDEHASPNEDMDANVFEDAGVRVVVGDGALTITAGGFTATISSAGLTMAGGTVEHDGRDIGSTHRHGGVLPGGSETDVPV